MNPGVYEKRAAAYIWRKAETPWAISCRQVSQETSDGAVVGQRGRDHERLGVDLSEGLLSCASLRISKLPVGRYSWRVCAGTTWAVCRSDMGGSKQGSPYTILAECMPSRAP